MQHKLKDSSLLFYYVIAGVLFVLLKLFYRTAETDNLFFLLKPVASLVALFSNADYNYNPGDGFFYEKMNIIIDKSCSGFNFGCLCFLLLCFSAFRYITNKKKRYFIMPVVLVVAYVATILVNTSRILLAVFVNKCISFWNVTSPAWLHLGEGVFVYLFSLILIYLLAEFVLLKIMPTNEKLA
ncbi:MAG: exosortase K [Bacteroides sp.]|nr:exosortase K [Bacteroides sp.]